MNLFPVIALLRQEMGLNPDSIGESAVMHAVQRRMASTAARDDQEYLLRLQASRDELQELIEEISVPETWFFREASAFDCVRSQVSKKFSAQQRPFSVACLPCATGEEAYSVAMTLLDMGLDPAKFRVHGLDISYRALLRAQQAVYPEYSFRSDDKTFRPKYFEASASGYQLNQLVKDQVGFFQGSALALNSPFDAAVYDVVFCRNMLIYLDQEARKLVMEGLKKILLPDGILLVGHSEISIALQAGFTRGADGALRLKKPAELPVLLSRRRKPLSPIVHQRESRVQSLVSKQPRPMPFASVASRPVAVQSKPVTALDVAGIRLLADTGRLIEASKQCEARLQSGERSADLYYLQGLILNAQGDTVAARECYRKVLYLAPQHAETRQQLAMMEQRLGMERRRVSAEHAHGSRRRGKEHG